MTIERFVIVRTDVRPEQAYWSDDAGGYVAANEALVSRGTVVDVIEADTDPASDDYELLRDTPMNRFVRSDVAQKGLRWTEEGGLKAP